MNDITDTLSKLLPYIFCSYCGECSRKRVPPFNLPNYVCMNCGRADLTITVKPNITLDKIDLKFIIK